MIIFGSGLSQDWHTQLRDPELWKTVKGVQYVSFWPLVGDFNLEFCEKYRRNVLIPLSLDAILNHPRGFSTLVPTVKALKTLNNKKIFWEFMIKSGHEKYIPNTFQIHSKYIPNTFQIHSKYIPNTSDSSFSELSFPLVIKRVDLFGGDGVYYVENSKELNRVLESEQFRAKEFLLQNYVQGRVEYVTHCVVRAGKILWHVTFQGDVPPQEKINRGAFAKKVSNLELVHLKLFSKIFELIEYTGPVCINFKIVDEIPKIFEINPRFGGSLFMSGAREHLVEALQTLVLHAD